MMSARILGGQTSHKKQMEKISTKGNQQKSKVRDSELGYTPGSNIAVAGKWGPRIESMYFPIENCGFSSQLC